MKKRLEGYIVGCIVLAQLSNSGMISGLLRDLYVVRVPYDVWALPLLIRYMVLVLDISTEQGGNFQLVMVMH